MSYETNFLKLERYRRLVEKHKRLFDERNAIVDKMQGLTSVQFDGTTSSAKNKPNYTLETLIQRKDEYDQRIKAINEELAEQRKPIYHALDGLLNDLEAYVLESHFINDMSLEDIAAASGYSESWIKQENIEGLKNIEL